MLTIAFCKRDPTTREFLGLIDLESVGSHLALLPAAPCDLVCKVPPHASAHGMLTGHLRGGGMDHLLQGDALSLGEVDGLGCPPQPQIRRGTISACLH